MAVQGDDVSSGRFRLQPFPRWLREVVLVGVIYLAYEASRGLQSGTFAVASRNGWDILRWERSWDLDPEHVLSHALIHVTPLAVIAAYFYSTAHYVITPLVLVWLYRSHRANYRTARTALAISTLMSLGVFYLLPTAPPRLLRGAGVPDALYDVRNWGWWGGEGSVPRGLGSITNQFAAMPSLHVGWALWCGYLLYRYCSRTYVRWLGVAYPVVTTLVVLSTGNHYLLDAIAGSLVMVIGAVLALGWTAATRRLGLRWLGRSDAVPTGRAAGTPVLPHTSTPSGSPKPADPSWRPGTTVNSRPAPAGEPGAPRPRTDRAASRV